MYTVSSCCIKIYWKTEEFMWANSNCLHKKVNLLTFMILWKINIKQGKKKSRTTSNYGVVMFWWNSESPLEGWYIEPDIILSQLFKKRQPCFCRINHDEFELIRIIRILKHAVLNILLRPHYFKNQRNVFIFYLYINIRSKTIDDSIRTK